MATYHPDHLSLNETDRNEKERSLLQQKQSVNKKRATLNELRSRNKRRTSTPSNDEWNFVSSEIFISFPQDYFSMLRSNVRLT